MHEIAQRPEEQAPRYMRGELGPFDVFRHPALDEQLAEKPDQIHNAPLERVGC